MNNKVKKAIILFMLVVTITTFVFENSYKILASDNNQIKYVYTIDGVNIREGATTSSKTLATVSWKYYKYLGEENAGSGCNDKWYKLEYNSSTIGYVCSTFATITNNIYSTTYDRPWTSPKKSIVGGAKFISSGYISKGQHTSYLKKYNVNPGSHYAVFTHQYMANLEAPSSEALTSYNSLAKNSLLDRGFNFVIPTYESMPESTYDPNIRKTYNEPISEIYQTPSADVNFENSISGFPDSYKPYLRYLHTIYPAWSFTPLPTKLDFNYSVTMQKRVGSIQGTYRFEKYESAIGCAFTYEESTGYCRTEPGWYVANDKTVSFFLDPRNFLSERYIFMFENLAYSDLYTENTVQSVLDRTYMNDISILDNQRYASIFVEAGQIANVSPLYLASLAVQESCVGDCKTTGLVTSGREFEYQGYTYSGLYNFFNIGAYSSEENPAKAGLVYANGGRGGNSFEPGTPGETPVNTDFISMLQVSRIGEFVKGYSYGTTVSSVKNKVSSNAVVIIKDSNGNVKSDSSKIATGDKIAIANSGANAEYTYIMYGDINGDGEINSADLLRIRQHLLGQINLSGAYFSSAELTGDGAVNSADLLKIRQHLLDISSIKQ